MLRLDYARLATSIEKVSHEQARRIIGSLLDRFKQFIGANIAAVWVIKEASGKLILDPYVDRGDVGGKFPEPIPLTQDARGLFPWVVLNKGEVWLPEIPKNPQTLKNCSPPYQSIE